MARYPAGGLVHWPGKEAGSKFDIQRSEAVKWLLTQPEIGNWLFQYFNKRGWLKYDPKADRWLVGVLDGAGPKGDPQRTGEVSKLADRLDPNTLLHLLVEIGGQSKMKPWKQAAEKRTGGRIGMWSFWHLVRPLIKENKVAKAGAHYVAKAAPEGVAPPEKLTPAKASRAGGFHADPMSGLVKREIIRQIPPKAPGVFVGAIMQGVPAEWKLKREDVIAVLEWLVEKTLIDFGTEERLILASAVPTPRDEDDDWAEWLAWQAANAPAAVPASKPETLDL